MKTFEVELVELATRPAAVVRDLVPARELAAFLSTVYGTVLEVLTQQGTQPDGPPFGLYEPTGEGFRVEAGFPVADPVAPSGQVVPGELPGGMVARIMHVGGYADVAATYDAVMRWLDTNGYVATGTPWESYLDEPDVAEPRTLVHVPCRRA